MCVGCPCVHVSVCCTQASTSLTLLVQSFTIDCNQKMCTKDFVDFKVLMHQQVNAGTLLSNLALPSFY